MKLKYKKQKNTKYVNQKKKSDRDLQIFVITNGRSTYKFALKCLSRQSVKCKVIKIKNMKWADALNSVVDRCTTKYLIRCDDDFLLHEYAVEFMINTFIQHELIHENLIMGSFSLWESFTRRMTGRIKIYRTKYVMDIGGFRTAKNGKVDRLFRKNAQLHNYHILLDPHSVVGVHAMGTLEEQQHYAHLWTKNNFLKYWKRYSKKQIERINEYPFSAKQQYNKFTGQFLYELNKKRNSNFNNFIEKKY